MLWHYGLIVVADDYLEFSLEVLGLIDERSLGIAFRIGMRCVHVALSIHHFVPLPVDDWAAGHSHLEDIGIVGHQ